MKAWKRRYSAIGVYIGGQNMACDYGNLSASWVKSVHSMGWSLLPLYVGLQAPCNRFPGKINRRSAASQGKSAADTAVGDAANFGMRKGTPIYFDMESYNNSNGRCRSAVLTFLDAWTRELHARRYADSHWEAGGPRLGPPRLPRTVFTPCPRVNGGAPVAPVPVTVRYMASWAPAQRRADGTCSRCRRDRLKGHAEAGP